MLSSIHLLRGIAALAVLIYHIYFVSKLYVEYSINTINYLHGGVDVFFVISGFIMYFVVYKATNIKVFTQDFLKEWAIRIVPLYWLVTICFYLIASFFFNDSNSNLSLFNLVMSLLFLPYGDGYIGFSYPVLGLGGHWFMKFTSIF